MSKIETSPEARAQVGLGWAMLVLFTTMTAFFFFLYCLFNWTFTWWLPIFVGMTYLVAHRYGTLLKEAEKDVEKAKVGA